MAHPNCPACGSSNVKHHRTRMLKSKRQTKQYLCRDCSHYYTANGNPRDERKCNETDWSSESSNRAIVQGTIRQEAERLPPTLQEIIKKFGIDEDIWNVERFVVNEWEQAQATKEGTPCIISLYQIKLTLVRHRAIETEIPPIKPIYIEVSPPKTRSERKGQRKKAVYLSDAHIGFHRDLRTGLLKPYHNRLHWSAMLSYLSANPVDLFVLGGDIMDMGDMSDKFAQTPEAHFTTQPALVETGWLIGGILQALPKNAKVVYLEGNHENRLPRYLLNHFSSAYNVSSVRFAGEPLLSVPELIVGRGVSPDRFEWVGNYPNECYWMNDSTRLIHGHVSKKRAGATAEAYLEEINASTIFGHTHRSESVSVSHHARTGQTAKTMVYTAQSFGMFGMPAQVPPFKVNHNWQQGFGLLEYDDAECAVQPISLTDEGFTVDDKTYIGSDYTDQIVKDTEWSALSLK